MVPACANTLHDKSSGTPWVKRGTKRQDKCFAKFIFNLIAGQHFLKNVLYRAVKLFVNAVHLLVYKQHNDTHEAKC